MEGPSNWIFIKSGWLIMSVVAKNYCVSMCVLNLCQDLFASCLKVFVGMGTKDNSLIRTEDSSSLVLWEEEFY